MRAGGSAFDMRVEEWYPLDRQIWHREQTGIRNYDVRWIGRSYRYDSAHIPAIPSELSSHSFQRCDNLLMLQADRGRKTTSKGTAKQFQQADSEPHPVWPPERKQQRFSSRNWDNNMCVDIIQQNRRQALVMKISFSSRNNFRPSHHLRIRWLGSEQTAVGNADNFRQEIFR